MGDRENLSIPCSGRFLLKPLCDRRPCSDYPFVISGAASVIFLRFGLLKIWALSMAWQALRRGLGGVLFDAQ